SPERASQFLFVIRRFLQSKFDVGQGWEKFQIPTSNLQIPNPRQSGNSIKSPRNFSFDAAGENGSALRQDTGIRREVERPAADDIHRDGLVEEVAVCLEDL